MEDLSEIIERVGKLADEFHMMALADADTAAEQAEHDPEVAAAMRQAAKENGDNEQLLRSLLAHVQDWRPIETLPDEIRDGRWLQLWKKQTSAGGYGAGEPMPVIARWEGPYRSDPSGCWDVPFEDAWYLDDHFTHWRPLPPSPTEGAEHG